MIINLYFLKLPKKNPEVLYIVQGYQNENFSIHLLS